LVDTSEPPGIFKPYPERIRRLIKNIHIHLTYKIIKETKNCYGKDSEIARFENDLAAKTLHKHHPFMTARKERG
jgi:hypothetical protein